MRIGIFLQYQLNMKGYMKMIYSVRPGMWETNSSTLHQFTICRDQIVQDEPTQPIIFIRIIEDIIQDNEFKAKDAEDRFNVIVTYAISDMIDSINDGKDAGENWIVPMLDHPQRYLNKFNITLEWIYNLQKKVMQYAVFDNPMRKDEWRNYAYYIKNKYDINTIRLVGSDMFTESSAYQYQIQKWPIDHLIKFILNDNSYYYQKNHADIDVGSLPNDEHFITVYSEE